MNAKDYSLAPLSQRLDDKAQNLEKRLDIFKGLDYHQNNGLNDDEIRILLKKTYFSYIEN